MKRLAVLALMLAAACGGAPVGMADPVAEAAPTTDAGSTPAPEAAPTPEAAASTADAAPESGPPMAEASAPEVEPPSSLPDAAPEAAPPSPTVDAAPDAGPRPFCYRQPQYDYLCAAENFNARGLFFCKPDPPGVTPTTMPVEGACPAGDVLIIYSGWGSMPPSSIDGTSWCCGLVQL